MNNLLIALDKIANQPKEVIENGYYGNFEELIHIAEKAINSYKEEELDKVLPESFKNEPVLTILSNALRHLNEEQLQNLLTMISQRIPNYKAWAKPNKEERMYSEEEARLIFQKGLNKGLTHDQSYITQPFQWEDECINSLSPLKEGEATELAGYDKEEFKKLTGHNNHEEMKAYEEGREHEQTSILKWIEKWDGFQMTHCIISILKILRVSMVIL